MNTGPQSSTVRAARRPVPEESSLTAMYWKAAREHRLAIQQCTACGRFHHPPVPQCQNCRSTDLGWSEVSGKGTVYSYTILRQSRVQGFEDAGPLACVAVELAEQARLLVLAHLRGIAPEDTTIGMPVTVTFEDVGHGVTLPQFRPASMGDD